MKRMFWLSFVLCLFSLISLAPNEVGLISPKSLFAATTVRFLYDGDGNRVAKIESGKTTIYVGDMEKNITTGEVTRYYAVGGKRVAVKDNSGLVYIVSEHLGSLRSLTDSTGNPKSDVRYYPYGQTRNKTGIIASRQYTSQINDDTTGLYFYNARYYNPTIGRFISADQTQSGNRYAYVENNPLIRIDPTGNQFEDPTTNLAYYICTGYNSEEACMANASSEYWMRKANKALTFARDVFEHMYDPTYANSRTFSVAEVNRILAKMYRNYWAEHHAGQDPGREVTREEIDKMPFGSAIPNEYDLSNINAVTLKEVNNALLLAIWWKENSFEEYNAPLNAHIGEKIMRGEDVDWSILVNSPSTNAMNFMYSARSKLGTFGSRGGEVALIDQQGRINEELRFYGPGYEDVKRGWLADIQGYYNLINKFVMNTPGYGWMMSDITAYKLPKTRGLRAE